LGAAEVSAATALPARYGFHATILAPFALADGYGAPALLQALAAFAGGRREVPVGRLRPAIMSDFIALVPCKSDPEVGGFAAECLEAFHHFRASLSDDERRRRIDAGLTPHQIELLDRWGYPYVLDEFRFHMTLAGPLHPDDRHRWLEAYVEAFAALSDAEVAIDALSLLHQESPERRFRLIRREPLLG
jgi:hypothetical protein